MPTGRLMQPAGEFSYVTPDGWYRSKPPGLEFTIVSTGPDQGVQPNIFVEYIVPDANLEPAVDGLIGKYRNTHRPYEVVTQVPFKTRSGMSGTKIAALRQDRDSLSLATYHYLITDVNRILVITCACADAVKQNYEPIFDEAMNSMESEREL